MQSTTHQLTGTLDMAGFVLSLYMHHPLANLFFIPGSQPVQNKIFFFIRAYCQVDATEAASTAVVYVYDSNIGVVTDHSSS